MQKPSTAADGDQNMETHKSGPPTMRCGENARPQTPPQASRTPAPAHRQHRPALNRTQRSHATAFPAGGTSQNAFPWPQFLSSGLAANRQFDGQDGLGTLHTHTQPHNHTHTIPTQHLPLPQPIDHLTPRPAVAGDFFPAPHASDRCTFSPQSYFKYHTDPSLLDTHIPHFMNLQPPKTMQTPPLSAHPSPNDTAMDEQPSRKRSHSAISNDQEFTQQMIEAAAAQSAGLSNGPQPGSRSVSVLSAGAETEGYSGRGSRAFKRGDAPKNEQGKYICDYTEDCHDVTFDRKCEWSKHMDKHDRPYRCPHQSCGKLQGFTYSGGLLRHEREVHGKHGGPKAQLMCPHTDCKRHAGKGFTRKENLNEHLRRVHFSRNPDSQNTGLGADDDDADADADSATQEAIAKRDPPNKRKRSMNDDPENVSEIVLLRQELAMLRAENERKDAVIQDLTRQLVHDQKTPEQNMQESLSGYQRT